MIFLNKQSSPALYLRRYVVSGIFLLCLTGITTAFGQESENQPVLHSQAFAEDLSLTAQSGSIVVLDAPPPDSPQTPTRYKLSGGRHEFCLSGDRSYVKGFVLEDDFGQQLLQSSGDPECAGIDLQPGIYNVQPLHARTAGSAPSRIAYLSVDPLNPPLTDNTGDAAGGFWAVQPDPNQDAQHRDGRLRALPPIVEGILGPYTPLTITGMPITMDYSGTQIDQYALFGFRYGASPDLKPFYPPNTTIDIIGSPVSPFENSGMLIVGNYACRGNEDFTCWLHRTNDPQSRHNGERLVIHDLGHYQFEFQYYGNPYFQPEPSLSNFWSEPYLGAQIDGDFPYVPGSVFPPNKPSGAPPLKPRTGPFRVLFRFFPDGRIGALQEGEVALYESCNYQGKAIVLGAGLTDFLKWNSDTVALNKMGASVRLGKNAAISFYEAANFGGASQTITADSPCTSNLPRASVQIQSITSILTSTGNCPKCQLTGLNLSGLNLPGADLGEANLEGANLNQTVLNHANLKKADLKGATLYGVVLDNANLESAVLQSAFLSNNPPAIPQAASLVSAFLRNANLSFAQMSGANFANASFYGFNGVERQTCAVKANGVTNGCATASHAIMNNTVFSGAYLFGVDFTNAQATGAVFSNAVLVGANFDKAKLGSDSTASTTTSFDSAFLQGVNLGTATLDHVSLSGAFVDFSPNGNTLDIKLPGSHTQFPGYWGQAGQGVCAEPGYSVPTTVPLTNSTIICPDGNKHSNGCGAADSQNQNSSWNNRTDIGSASTPASYQNNATYTPASATPICSDDVQWDVGGAKGKK